MTVNARDVEFHRQRHPRPQPSTESTPTISSNPITPTISSRSFTPFNPQPRNLEVHMPAPPLNRDQYINDPDGDISDPDRVISDDALPPQSSIVHSAPAGSTRSGHLIRPQESITGSTQSGHPIRPLEPIDNIHEKVLVASTTTIVDKLDNEPRSYKQAIKSPDSDRWISAMQQELDTLHYNNTWSVVPLPRSDRNIVGSKWIYKIKRDANGDIARYKARLVAQGFSQQPGIDFNEIFSPVVRYDSLRLLIAEQNKDADRKVIRYLIAVTDQVVRLG